MQCPHLQHAGHKTAFSTTCKLRESSNYTCHHHARTDLSTFTQKCIHECLHPAPKCRLPCPCIAHCEHCEASRFIDGGFHINVRCDTGTLHDCATAQLNGSGMQRAMRLLSPASLLDGPFAFAAARAMRDCSMQHNTSVAM